MSNNLAIVNGIGKSLIFVFSFVNSSICDVISSREISSVFNARFMSLWDEVKGLFVRNCTR